jgi:hypothetical protein
MPQRVEFGINKIGGLVPNRMTCETLISLFRASSRDAAAHVLMRRYPEYAYKEWV